MPKLEGTFRNAWKPTAPEAPEFRCRCGSDEVLYRVWESDDGAYEDVKYRCGTCGRTWWVEGSDA